MKHTSFVRLVAIVLAALVVLTGAVGAQDSAATGTYTGVVDAFNANVVVASGVVFDVSNALTDGSFTLRTGIPVEIEFTISRGILSATRLASPSGGTPGAGQLTGVVELASETTFVINGLSFSAAGLDIDDDDVFKTGAQVQIDFSVTSGAFAITDIDLADSQIGVMIGRVDTLDVPRMEVGTVPFDIARAVVNDNPYALETSALVKVEFRQPPTGIAQASSVDVRAPALTAGQSDDFSRVVLAGTVTARDDDSITVAGVEVPLDTSVRVDDDVQVGEAARVTFRPDVTTNEIRPTRVRGLDDIDDVDDVLDDFDDDDDDDGDDDDRDDNDDDNGDDDDDRDDNDDDSGDDDRDDDGDDDDDDRDDDDDDGCRIPAGWTTYRVRSGDTLSRIAGAAGTSVQELVSANCLSSANLIRVGQSLFVPSAVAAPSNSGSGGGGGDDDDDDDGGGSAGGGGSTGGGDDDDDDGGGDDDDDGGDDDDD
ncbi:MAG: LysM peptidoglycan-binding domain-containing protein [Chloroflexi bacterium]|nr:LysM peptidoglycan-binding domain-containing protein [Chloroflexota bacterium]